MAPVQLPTAPRMCIHPDADHWLAIDEECQAPTIGASVTVWNWLPGHVLAVDVVDKWAKVRILEPTDGITDVCWVQWCEL
jgi:hypothetical protein